MLRSRVKYTLLLWQVTVADIVYFCYNLRNLITGIEWDMITLLYISTNCSFVNSPSGQSSINPECHSWKSNKRQMKSLQFHKICLNNSFFLWRNVKSFFVVQIHLQKCTWNWPDVCFLIWSVSEQYLCEWKKFFFVYSNTKIPPKFLLFILITWKSCYLFARCSKKVDRVSQGMINVCDYHNFFLAVVGIFQQKL